MSESEQKSKTVFSDISVARAYQKVKADLSAQLDKQPELHYSVGQFMKDWQGTLEPYLDDLKTKCQLNDYSMSCQMLTSTTPVKGVRRAPHELKIQYSKTSEVKHYKNMSWRRAKTKMQRKSMSLSDVLFIDATIEPVQPLQVITLNITFDPTKWTANENADADANRDLSAEQT